MRYFNIFIYSRVQGLKCAQQIQGYRIRAKQNKNRFVSVIYEWGEQMRAQHLCLWGSIMQVQKGVGFGSLLHHPWWLSCQVAKGRFPRGPGAPGFKGHLDAESWTVVHKQHSDMCSEHPISWNTNRARAIWRTGDQFEKCEQLKQYEATALLPEMLKRTPGRKQRDM